MPGRDQTGPMGNGQRTGRGFGICSANLSTDNASQMSGRGFGNGLGRCRGWGGGMGRRRGAGRSGNFMQTIPEQTQETLKIQQDAQQSQLNEINKKLEELTAQEAQKK